MTWKRADWKVMNLDGNRSDLSKVAVSVTDTIHGMVSSVPIIVGKTGSEQDILGRPFEPYDRKCERNLDDGRFTITMCAVHGSEQVSFVSTFRGDKRDRFAIILGNQIGLVNVSATRQDRPWPYEEIRLESAGMKHGNKKGSNGTNGEGKFLVDRPRVHAGKLRVLYRGKEQEMSKEEGKQ